MMELIFVNTPALTKTLSRSSTTVVAILFALSASPLLESCYSNLVNAGPLLLLECIALYAIVDPSLNMNMCTYFQSATSNSSVVLD